MFLEFYQLREQPFGVTPDPRFLYFGPGHREALASLMYSIETRRGFSAMVAEPGMGKTTLLFRLLETLRGTSRTAFLFQTEGDSRDLLRGVLADLGIAAQSTDLVALHEALNGALLEEMRAGRQVVVILDEAQNLDEKSLESVRLLSNFETSTQKLMHIVLAGQPKLGERLAGAELKQLRQRVSTIIRLDPFSSQETEAYIDWRLQVAGSQGPSPFSTEALDMISRVSKGIPRNINCLCFQALSIGFAMQSKMIGVEILREVVADLDPSPRRSYRVNTSHTAVPTSPTSASIAEPALESAPVGPRSVPGRPAPLPSPAAISEAPIWTSWAIAPPPVERLFRAKRLALLACVVVPVLLVLVLSNPRLGLSGTSPGELSGQIVNAVLSSSDPNSDFVPSVPNGLKAPAAPPIQKVEEPPTATATTSATSQTLTDDTETDAPQARDSMATSDAGSHEQAALTPVARKSPAVAAEPRDRGTRPSRRKNSVVQVTRRENLFEFALENYGKSSRTIVDEIRLLNPQISGPYDILHAGEWIELPTAPSIPASETRSR